ncbi:MAG: flavohemoglobin expression-modulating QEGLA motif protein [Gammaproteobacteria bacterium]|nr:flavohemoglobin expression-modulating QEGLA motif protein [Gammaproteobacteria bacterium]
MNTSRLSKVTEQDALLVQTVQPIKILGALSWPAGVETKFLESWRAGKPELPVVHLEQQDYSKQVEVLNYIQTHCDRSHPLDNLIYKTARSYSSAARMLGAIGTPDFTRYSIELYGKPNDVYKTQDWTALDAADFFLRKTDELLGGYVVPPTVADIPVEVFAERLQKSIDDFFVDDKVSVIIDAGLSARAIAGSSRVRLRAGAMFSELDLNQLLEHEAHIHAATMHNGKRQRNLQILSLGAPRTTRAQEGIAVMAELLTLALDIVRLRRIALRVKAIAMALDGADFIDIFKSFLEAGQTEEESYQSTVRCFRGGDVKGGSVFTKDTVYLKGLMEVHAFLAVAIHDNRPELVNALFAGRMSLGDVVELASYFETGFLVGAHYIPHWASDLRTLASVLACNAFFTRVDLTHVKLENFIRLEEGLATGEA